MRLATTFVTFALGALVTGGGSTSTLVEAPGRPVGTTTAASSLSAFISGPSQVRSGGPCEWIAAASGGTAPYTYDWTDTRTASHSSEQVYVRTFFNSAIITLTVTDAAGQAVTRTRSASISPSAPICYP